MGGLDGVAPALAGAFLRMQAAASQAGYSIGVGSGYRDSASQARLRREHCCNDPNSSKCGCGPPTAPVGRSNHQHGLAIDVAATPAAKRWLGQNASKFGLHLPVEGEDWHIELMGSDGAWHGQGAQQMGAVGLDLNWLGQAQSPEEAQDQKVASIMDAITGAQREDLMATPEANVLATPVSPELAAPTAPQLGSPGSPGEAQQPIRMETSTIPGAPGAPAAGGQWQGKVPPPGYVPPGEGVGRWRPIMEAALRYAGINPTPELVNLGLRRMGQESSGNPTAVNNWDINAKRGDPSKGLMQNIGSAFPERARELTNRGIFDGFANIVASIRYTVGRYGSLQKGWGRSGGY